jgi:hypothetical protein
VNPLVDPPDHADGGDEPEGEGAELLNDLRAVLTRYVVFPSAEAGDAVALWIAATHAQPAWEHATRLVLKSPLKRCGKSRLLDLLEALCHRVLITANISPAALARSISADDPPAILVDEADTAFATRRGERSETVEVVRGLVNAGFQRARPYTRWGVATRTLEECPTFAMAALAGIGDLPDTIEDHAVVVTMRRRAPSERVIPLRRRRDLPALVELRDRLHPYIRGHRGELERAEPTMPVEDRAADCWEPLVAVADLAGGRWPELARTACKKMTAAAADAEGSFAERLLADLRVVFGDAPTLWTATIIERLAALDEAPWADYYGQRVTDRAIAKLLRPYGVRSRDIKGEDGKAVRKGYYREDLHDTWQRYTSPGATSATSATAQLNRVADGSASEASATVRYPLTSEVAEVADVAATRDDGRLLDPGSEPDDPGRWSR